MAGHPLRVVVFGLGLMVGAYARAASPQVNFFVAPSGNDAWSGRLDTANAAGTDGPFATLTRAHLAVRQNVKADPDAPITVFLEGGTYPLEHSLELSPADCPTGGRLSWAAWHDRPVRLVGGREVNAWQAVTDQTVLDRLAPEARSHVMQADLKALGITDFGSLKSRGYGRATTPAHLELFFRGQPMTLARWPNQGFVKIAGLPAGSVAPGAPAPPQGKLNAGFLYESDRPKGWKSLEDVWAYGYWARDWSASYEKIATLDPEQRLIKTAAPFGNIGFRVGQRFYFMNVLEELDEPGEWYLDRSSGVLYFWPPEALGPGLAEVSLLEAPLVLIRDAANVTLQGVTFEDTRGRGVEVYGGSGVLIRRCVFRDLGTDAIFLAGGRDARVEGCHISNTGDAGIRATGGDRKKLESCGHVIENNTLDHIGRWSRCYVPAISLDGVGIRVAHNLIHDHPHAAIILAGNDHVVEYNEVHHVALETGDVGAIYMGRDWTYLGNVIRYNFVHDAGGVGMGAVGVYLDDCAGGTVVEGNVFRNVNKGVLVGGGRHNLIENNIFMDCPTAVQIDARGLSQAPNWRDMLYKTMKPRLEVMNYAQPPYSLKYPQLQELTAYLQADAGVPPEGNRVDRNICVGGKKWLTLAGDVPVGMVQTRDNLTDRDPRFVDAAKGDLRLRADSPALGLGFKPIPFDEIGPPKAKVPPP